MNYSTQTLVGFERSSPVDLYALKPAASTPLPFFINADPNTLYEKPIAVLIGPFSISQGDFTAYKFRYLSSAQFFGKSVNGAVSGMITEEPVVSGFYFMVPFFLLVDHRDPNTLLLRKEFPNCEPVWFDKDDIALGDDTVAKRALAWITSVAHAHRVIASRGYFRPGLDTVRLTASVENPQGHPISVTARFMADTIAVDSTLFADDGQHGDGAAGDGLWGTSWSVPADERFYGLTTRVVDPGDPSTFSMPYAARFTTAGPVVCVGDTAYTVPAWGQTVNFRLKVSNEGSSVLIPAVRGMIRALDTAATISSGNPIAVGDISPGQVRLSGMIKISFSQWCTGTRDLPFELVFSINAIEYWRDTLVIQVASAVGIVERHESPMKYELGQNYPNPFNPTTTIEYTTGGTRNQGSGISEVRLVVYDLLGREVAVLVNEMKTPGTYEVTFDVSRLASGVYLYRLTAGEFIQTRKLLLLR
jgi:hypothetical protein